MRIAVTGTHGVGKSTLIEDFVAAHAGHESVAEPYWLLAQTGVLFADGVTVADLEEQLRQSCALILDQVTGPDVVFDRCPLDFLAYLDVVSAQNGFEWVPSGRLLGRIGKALASLDLIVFVPLQTPDEIAVAIEHPRLRAQVDGRLKAIVRRDELGLFEDRPRRIEVWGARQDRVNQLAAAL